MKNFVKFGKSEIVRNIVCTHYLVHLFSILTPLWHHLYAVIHTTQTHSQKAEQHKFSFSLKLQQSCFAGDGLSLPFDLKKYYFTSLSHIISVVFYVKLLVNMIASDWRPSMKKTTSKDNVIFTCFLTWLSPPPLELLSTFLCVILSLV